MEDETVAREISSELRQVPAIEIPLALKHTHARSTRRQDPSNPAGLRKHKMPFPQ
jgi:hypothetical protein